MHPTRAFASLAVGIIVVGMIAWPMLPASFSFGTGLARAEPQQKVPAQQKAPKKAAPKKGTSKPAPKVTPKQAEQPRTAFTPQEQAIAVVPGNPDARVWGDSAGDFQRVLPQASGPWLALSGGGADGAFGAGLITGWTQAGNRPEFAMVTGASIGALISPYVFLGPRYDNELRDALVSITGADIFEDRPTRQSFLDTWPLKRLIEKRVTPELMAEVAAEYRRGRRLLVITTNVDAGRRVIWNMGAIAEGGDQKALKLFRDVLVASSSIPGFFPPVEIEVEANGRKFQEMHLDGTVTAPFFIVPEAMLGAAGGSRLPATEVYIILNSKLVPDFEMPERDTRSILGRLISVVLKTGLRAELLLVGANAQRLGVPLKVAYVAESFQQPARGLFDEKYMKALFEFGAEQARKGSAFENVVPGAPDLRTGTPQ